MKDSMKSTKAYIKQVGTVEGGVAADWWFGACKVGILYEGDNVTMGGYTMEELGQIAHSYQQDLRGEYYDEG